MNIEKKTLEKVDVLYDDKKWGKRIDPDEWNANFKALENAHNQLVDSLTEQVNIVDEAFSNATTEGGDNIHVDYSGSDFTLQQTLDHIVSDINDRYTKLQSDAVLSENTNLLIRDIFYNSQTGTFTITKKDGSVITIDTVIEKVPASMALKEEADGSVWLVVTNQDGSQTKTNVTSLIEDTVINGSDTINVSSSTDSSNKVTTYTLNIKPNSIGLSHVDSELTAKFEETQNAKNLAVQAKDLAVSAKNEAVTAKNTAVEAKDAAVSAKSDAEKILGLTLSYSSNAKGYAEQASSYKNSAEAAKIAAEKARDEAQTIAGGNYATKSELNTHVNNTDIHVTAEEKAAFSNQSPFIVTLIYGEDNLGKPVYTADKTFDEIESAVSSGKRVYCLDFPTNVIVPYVCRLYKDTDIYCHYFSLVTNRYYRDITISNENVVTFNYSAGNDHLLPSSGLPDSGKVLAVNSQGDPEWTDDLTSHTGNTTAHITAAERTKWNQAVTDVGNLSEEVADLQGGVVSIPDYWVSELEAKADAIQVAMEKAGRKKSAFLWYTDAHWVNGNSKKSPMILDYLYRNTPMNKTKFGGDIIGDTLLATRDEMKYLYEWRRMIRDIRNHHSVFGNHDMFNLDSVDYENDNYRYAFLLAPEETADMVWGDGNYYYIDNPAENTRYLHLAYLTSDLTAMMAQGQFICDAIKSVPEGWHIVAIAHRWWQYSSSSTPTTGSIPTYEAEMLDVFDKYNARATRSGSNYFYAQDFTEAKGKVEFCIGGHIHVDYDFFTAGGIPVIITTADANQNRVPDSTVDSGTTGTITEAAVFGIIADYNEEITKITVVGVGRGTSRVVRASMVTPTSISNISYSGDTTVESAIDKAKFSFTVNYSDGSTSSVTGASTVTPATIEAVGNNSITITYIENGITLTGTVTIVGTAKPTVNLFDQNDPDVLLRGRINSSGNAVEYADNQVLSGYIEAKPGDIFTVTSDKANNANPYTGSITAFKSDKAYLVQMNKDWTGVWNWSEDYLTGTLTIPTEEYNGIDFANTAYVRVCMAYYDLDNIIITKS